MNETIIKYDTKDDLFGIMFFTISISFMICFFCKCLYRIKSNLNIAPTSSQNEPTLPISNRDTPNTRSLIIHNIDIIIPSPRSPIPDNFIYPPHSPNMSHMLNTPENEFICPICLDEFNNDTITTLDCSHQFHAGCIDAWIVCNSERKYVYCPICNHIILQNY